MKALMSDAASGSRAGRRRLAERSGAAGCRAHGFFDFSVGRAFQARRGTWQDAGSLGWRPPVWRADQGRSGRDPREASGPQPPKGRPDHEQQGA